MVHEDTLSSVLSDFARTMLTDFRIQAILDRLVERIVGVLDVTGAGVTLIAPGLAPGYVAASDHEALLFERLQTELGQGPCLTAYESGLPVSVPDVADDSRYPEFGPAAHEAGLAAVFTFPLRHGAGRLGALDLYRGTTGPLHPREVLAAQTLADVAAAYLLNARAREQVLVTAERHRQGSALQESLTGLHDPLTGLPDRLLLEQRLEHAAQRAQRSHGTCAVLIADLDRSGRAGDGPGGGPGRDVGPGQDGGQVVGDPQGGGRGQVVGDPQGGGRGQVVGDGLLVAVADRLAGLLRAGDTLARVSDGAFVVLCEDLEGEDDAALLAARLGDAFRAPFRVTGALVPGGLVHVGARVGVAYSGPGELVGPHLVTDGALDEARRRGGGTSQPEGARAGTPLRARNDLEQDLRVALGRADLDVGYQPVVRTADGLVVGVEALLRWTHPVRGAVPALTAVGIAEQTGLIAELGAWVLRRCCHDHARWLADHPARPLDLSINVSGRQVMRPGFTCMLEEALEETGMDPSALTLEVTEGVFIDDGELAMSVFADVKALGVQIALDDFGTGYSSLGYLRRFPVDVIKIDRGFVADVEHDPSAHAIVTAASDLAHAMGMTVTAEGVETEEQRREVDGIGCEQAQGFLFAGALSRSEISARLRTSPAGGLRLP